MAARAQDKEGLEFWHDNFGTADKADVAVFAERLAERFRKDIDPLITYKIVDHIIGKDDGDGGEELIVLEQWEAFLAKFGPFAECMNRTKASMIDKEGNIQPWFHGHISRDNASQYFLQEAGYFLVRYGSQESDRDKLVMSYARIKDEDGKRAFVTKSTYIVIDPKKGYHMSSDSDGPGYWFATLPQMFAERWVGLSAVPSKLYSKFAVHGNKASTSYSYYGDKKGSENPLPRYVKRPLNKYSYIRYTGESAPTIITPSSGASSGGRATVSTAPSSHYAHYTGEASAVAAAAHAPAAKPHAAGAMYAAYNDQAVAANAGAGGNKPHSLVHQPSATSSHPTVAHVAQRIITASGHAEKPTPAAHAQTYSAESNYAAYGLEDGKHGSHRGSGSGSDHGKKDSKKDNKSHAPAPVSASATYASYDINAQPASRGVDRVQSTPVSRLTHAVSGLAVSGKPNSAGGAESNYQTYEEAAGGPAGRNQTFAGNSHAPVHKEAGAAYHAYQGFQGGKR